MSPIPTLTLEAQHLDLQYVRKVLEDYHPGLHVYADEATLDAAFERAEQGFSEGATPREFIADLALGVEAIGCTHTTLRVPDRTVKKERFFPFDLVVVDDGLWLDPRTHQGPPRELVAVEGMEADTLLAELRARISSDGRSLARKDAYIDRAGGALVTPIVGAREVWTITTRAADASAQQETLPAIPWKEMPRPAPLRPEPVLALEEGVGRLTWQGADLLVAHLPEFAGSDRDSAAVVANLRAQAADADAVILDLRGNGGGRTRSLLDLWALFADRPLLPYVDAWSLRSWSGWERDPDGVLWRPDPDSDDLYPTLEPQPGHLDLPVVVVVDGTTGSSASDLAFFFHWTERGTVVGSETASGRWLQNCEVYLTLELPESRATLRVPLQTLVTADREGRGSGVVPHVPVTPAVADLAAGRDVVLERAFQIARDLAQP